jgi:ABC-2 type transport system permease protein
VLVEGNFPSVFENRMLSGLKLTGNFNYKKESLPTKMLFVADGDIIRNDIKQTAQGTMLSPLGLDKYTSQNFGNKEFVLNAVNYLAGENEIMQLRTREVKLRLLDKPRLQEEKLKWQLINVLCPLIIVLILGIGISVWRKKKFAF